MTPGRDVVHALHRFWWGILLAGFVAFGVAYLVGDEPPHVASFRATVLIPGDTEDTGSAERPELMVLDDLGPFVSSWVFAQLVAEELGGDATADAIHGMVFGSRYSRIATVSVTADDAEQALAVAEAAAAVFPAAVDDFLVAPGSEAAAVQVIDPPHEATRDFAAWWTRNAAITVLTVAVVTAIAVLVTPARDEDAQVRSGTTEAR